MKQSEIVELEQRVDTLERELREFVFPSKELGKSQQAQREWVTCVATEAIERYETVLIYENSTSGRFANVKKYPSGTPAETTYTVAIAKTNAVSGEPAHVQCEGIGYVKINQESGIVVGDDLGPDDGVATKNASDVVWTALEDAEDTDELLLVKFKGGGTAAIWAQITGKVENKQYTVSLYENGKYDDDGNAASATSTGQTCYIQQIRDEEIIPNGTWVMVTKHSGHYEGQIAVILDDS